MKPLLSISASLFMLLVAEYLHTQTITSDPGAFVADPDESGLRSLTDVSSPPARLYLPHLDPPRIPLYMVFEGGVQFGWSPGFAIPVVPDTRFVQTTASTAQVQGGHLGFGIRLHENGDISPDFGAVLKVALQYQSFVENLLVDNVLIIRDGGGTDVVHGSGSVSTKRALAGIDLMAFYDLNTGFRDPFLVEFGLSMDRELYRHQSWSLEISIDSQDSVAGSLGSYYQRDCRCVEDAGSSQSSTVSVAGIIGLMFEGNVRIGGVRAIYTPFLRIKHGIVTPAGASHPERSIAVGVGVYFRLGLRLVEYPHDD